jgi:hypothetical protein
LGASDLCSHPLDRVGERFGDLLFEPNVVSFGLSALPESFILAIKNVGTAGVVNRNSRDLSFEGIDVEMRAK